MGSRGKKRGERKWKERIESGKRTEYAGEKRGNVMSDEGKGMEEE